MHLVALTADDCACRWLCVCLLDVCVCVCVDVRVVVGLKEAVPIMWYAFAGQPGVTVISNQRWTIIQLATEKRRFLTLPFFPCLLSPYRPPYFTVACVFIVMLMLIIQRGWKEESAHAWTDIWVKKVKIKA